MDFIDKINELAARVPKQLSHIQTEEATKNALVMPFIGALGYNVFDPTEVTPELDADFGVKKGEKVDYAILRDGKPIMLFECKWHGRDLDKTHASQLYRYFSVTQARFGVLTNGIEYRFFTDLEATNKMDEKPFFEFNLRDFKERHVDELKKFSKSTFDAENITATASELKYTRAIKRLIAAEIQDPSDDFVRFFAAQVYSGRLMPAVREQFAGITKRALQQYINDRINQRLESALAGEQTYEQPSEMTDTEAQVPSVQEDAPEKSDVETTEEELEAFYIIKAILRDTIDTRRVAMRDVKSYCGILLDDNNRQPICRLHFNTGQLYVGLFDDNKQEERVPIDDVDEIFEYSARIIDAVKMYDPQWEASKHTPKTVSKTSSQSVGNFTGKKLHAVTIDGQQVPANTWKDGMMAVFNLMLQQDATKFKQVALTLAGRKRSYVTRDQEQLRSPQLIPGTDLYVETNLSSNTIANVCSRLVEGMGKETEDLVFHTS